MRLILLLLSVSCEFFAYAGTPTDYQNVSVLCVGPK